MADERLREVAGRAIGIILDLSSRANYRIEVRGLENHTRSPSTLVVFNHRRDDDVPIIANVLFGRRGLFAANVMPLFVTREDLFRRGFLRDYLEGWPPLFRKPLVLLDLRPALWALRAYRMRRVAEMTVGEVLEDVFDRFGDLPLDEVLKPRWVERFERMAGQKEERLHVRKALRRRFFPLLRQGYGLTKLTRSRFQALKPYERAVIESQLQVFIDALERGETVQMAPEGAASRDGRFARIRAGLHVLLNRPRVQVRVLPVAITYDFMTCGRQRAFVNVGPEIPDLSGLPPSETSARVAEAILSQSTITTSQLASQMLLTIQSRGGGMLTKGQLLEHVTEEANRWTKAGLYVDPRLLTSEERIRRVDEYVEYCLRSGELVSREAGGFWVPRHLEQVSASYTNPEGAISYINNELSSLTRLLRNLALNNP